MSDKVIIPSQGEAIKIDSTNEQLIVPNHPIVSYILGDGIGQDITPVVKKIIDAAVARAYQGERKIEWLELYAGERAAQMYGNNNYLPQETLEYLEKYVVGIKGPLTTPVGGGIRSLNVTIRKKMDLYSIVRPIRFFPGVPSPLKHPEKTNMVIFREATEDVYAGIEWESQTAEVEKIIKFLTEEMNVDQIKNADCGIGIKYISRQGTERIMRRAINYARLHNCPSITLVHKGNIMKYTEGAFRNWCYSLAKEEFGAIEENGVVFLENSGQRIIINDVIADNFLQKILLQPQDYSLILTMNLNGDYISDALAAQVGGLGFAPGANIGDRCAVFEATHGTAPGSAGLNKSNPSSLLLSGEMMLRHMSWNEAADCIIGGLERTLEDRIFTYDLTKGTDQKSVSTSSFGNAIIERL